MIVKTTLLLYASACLYLPCSSQTVSDSIITTLEKVTVTKESAGYNVDEVSSSLKLKTELLHLPQNIQVISGKLISDQQLTDMSDAVTRNVSGAASSVVDNWGNYANLRMRGGIINSFRNGMNIKMPWGPLTEDMSMIERIEIVKGPAGFMLANGEAAGSYNVVTKKPTGNIKSAVSITSGSFGLYRAALDSDGKLNKSGRLLYRLNVMGQTKKSHREFDFNKRYLIFPVISYHADDKTVITAEYIYQHMKMAMLGSAYLFSLNMGDLPRNSSMLEPNLEPTTISDHNITVSVNHHFSDQLQFIAQLAYCNYLQKGSSVWPAYPAGLNDNGDLLRSISNWDAFGVSRLGQMYLNGNFIIGKIRHHILAGLDRTYKNYCADFYQSSLITAYDDSGNSIPFNIYQPVHGNVPAYALPVFDRSQPIRERGFGTMGESVSSLYLYDELHVAGDKLRVTFAARFTKLNQHSFGVYSYDKKLTPRAGVSFSLNTTTSAYVLYDQSFTGQQGTDSSSRPFKPLIGKNIEAGIKKDWFNRKLNSSFSFYQITRNNLITIIPGPVYKAVQSAKSTTRGIELDVKGEPSKNINVVANYAFTKTIDGEEFPEHTGNAWISFQLQKMNISLGYQWQGGRPYRLPDLHRMDAAVNIRLRKITFSMQVNNLLNSYLYAGKPFEYNNDPRSTEYYFQVEPGINVRWGVSYRF